LYCSGESACLAGHDYAAYQCASQAPRYAHALLNNARALLFSRCSQIFLYSSLIASYGTCGDAEALPSGEAGSGAVGHVATPDPSRAGMRGPELWDMWRRRSPPERGGEIRSHRMSGGARALLNGAVGSGATRHVAACGHTRHASCLSLEPACGGTRSTGCRQPSSSTCPPSYLNTNLDHWLRRHH
jgi:hypothetical protein